MHADAIRGRLESFLAKRFPVARKRGIGLDDRLLGAGIIDSLGVLDIVGYLEDQFRIVIVDEDLSPENFETLGCLAAFVERKLSGSEAGTYDGNGARSPS